MDRGRLYRMLVSIKTSLVFLGIFAFLFFVGTVFPQETGPDRIERYREAGGKFVSLVAALDLLNIFHTWYFALIASLFAFHLLLCSIHRLDILRRRPTFRPFSREDLLQREHSFSVSSPGEGTEPDIEKLLRRLGFKRVRYYSENANVKRIVSEKGCPFRWLSWAYHFCILLAIAGFCASYLLAFEDYFSIGESERKPVPLDSPSTNWRKLKKLLDIGGENKSRSIEVELEGFTTAYVQKPMLNYPARPGERLKAAWGIGGEKISYSLTKDSVFPTDWFSLLKIYDFGELVKEKKIQVNDPLRYAGLTFYQIGYEHVFDLRVGDETLKDLTAGAPFEIPQMEGQFRLRTPRTGTLVKYDGEPKLLTPSARFEYRPPSTSEPRKWSRIADLSLDQPADVMHTDMTFTNLREKSILSYRYDPGVPILWITTIGLMILMALRIYMPWYRVHCHADLSAGRALITVSIRMVGLFARPERLRRKLCEALQADAKSGSIGAQPRL